MRLTNGSASQRRRRYESDFSAFLPQCQNQVNPEDRFCLHCETPNWNYVPEDFPTRAYDYTVIPDGIEEA